MNDGPQGFRAPDSGNQKGGSSTQFPCNAAIGATWDRELSELYGKQMGKEFKKKGANMILGPGLNVLRVPYNGRTFEYISGEDPVLGSILVGPPIDGMQENAMAVAKHFILNNQELDRQGVNEIVDEKTLIELYAPPFETAAKHEVACYMW